MRPFVDLIGIASDEGKEADMPGEPAKKGRKAHEQAHDEHQVPVTLPPRISRHVSWQVVVDGGRLSDEAADQRRVLADVGVLDPVDETGGEISGENDTGCLKGNGDEFVHGAATTARDRSRRDIDRPKPSIDFVNARPPP